MIIVAACVDNNNVMGVDGQLAYKLPGDLSQFKKLTWGKTIICGRPTFDEMGILPNRETIVLSKKGSFKIDNRNGNSKASKIRLALPKLIPDAIIKLASERPEVFIIGGSIILENSINLADKLIITRPKETIEFSGKLSKFPPIPNKFTIASYKFFDHFYIQTYV
jgi:dihydrofolate reductase